MKTTSKKMKKMKTTSKKNEKNEDDLKKTKTKYLIGCDIIVN